MKYIIKRVQRCLLVWHKCWHSHVFLYWSWNVNIAQLNAFFGYLMGALFHIPHFFGFDWFASCACNSHLSKLHCEQKSCGKKNVTQSAQVLSAFYLVYSLIMMWFNCILIFQHYEFYIDKSSYKRHWRALHLTKLLNSVHLFIKT